LRSNKRIKNLRYSAVNSENFASLIGTKRPNDLVEKFRIGPLNNPFSGSRDSHQWHYFPNNFPPSLPHFETALTQYYQAMEGLSLQLAAIFEDCLSCPEGLLTCSLKNHTSILTANYYPPVETLSVLPNQMRVSPHTDVSLFTIININQDGWKKKSHHQEESTTTTIIRGGKGEASAAIDGTEEGDDGGLEIFTADGSWSKVPPREDAFVVNVGDCLRDWTSGKFASTLHRVTLPASVEAPTAASPGEASDAPGARRSLAYFAAPSPATDVTPLSSSGGSLEEGDSVDRVGHSDCLTYEKWRKLRVKDAMNKLKKK
jgi:isopenicillin N synthase-like dioxygenase